MVEDVDKLLGLIELENDIIQKGRKEIARLKEEKITKRAEAWANATGTAKEKEYCYNTIELANTKLVYCDE